MEGGSGDIATQFLKVAADALAAHALRDVATSLGSRGNRTLRNSIQEMAGRELAIRLGPALHSIRPHSEGGGLVHGFWGDVTLDNPSLHM